MIRRLLFVLVVLFFAVWIGLHVNADEGSVLITYNAWTVEVALWMAVGIALLAFFVTYLLVRLISRSFQLPKQWRHWREQRRHYFSAKGLLAFLVHDWQAAYRAFSKVRLKNEEETQANQLMAGLSALKSGQNRQFMKMTQKLSDRKVQVIALLMQADTLIEENQPQKALVLLDGLASQRAEFPFLILLLSRCYQALSQWDDLKNLLPALKSNHLLTDKQHAILTKQTYTQLLVQHRLRSDAQGLIKAWRAIPSRIRSEEALLVVYVDALLACGEEDEARQIITRRLRSHWSAALLSRYGDIQVKHANRQISTAEGWLKKRPEDSTLLLVLGKLCLQQALWGKAETYLLESVHHAPSKAAYQLLGEYYLEQQQPEKAAQCLQQALQLQ